MVSMRWNCNSSQTSQNPHDYHHHTLFHSKCPLITHLLWTALIWLTHSPVDTHTWLLSSHSSSLWMFTNHSLTHSLTDKSTPAWLPSSHYFLLWMPINCSLTPDCSDLTHSQPSWHPHTITIITLLITLNAHKLLTHSLTHSHAHGQVNIHTITIITFFFTLNVHQSLTYSGEVWICWQLVKLHLYISYFLVISLCNLVSHLKFTLSTSIRNFLTTTPTRAYDLHACFLHATANFTKRSSKCKVASVFIGRNVSGTRCIRH